MYVQSLIIALLSAGALALPANNTSPRLERRQHYGWVGTYPTDDHKCSHVNTVGPNERPELHIPKCMTFKRDPKTNAGIWWGSGSLRINEAHFFYDEHCTDWARNVQKPSKGEAFTCVDGTKDARPWKSTAGAWNFDLGSEQDDY